MSNEETLREHQRRIEVIETVINGTVRDGKRVDGIMDTVARHHTFLVGDKDIGSTGLVQAVERLTTVLKYGTGALFAWHVFKEVYGLLK
jgi:hypothetical protein